MYADDRGRRHAIALDEAGAIDFGRTRPFRQPPAYRGQRNFPGWWWSATTRSHVVYESWLERHHIIEADRDARVAGIAGQPFALTWPSRKREARHNGQGRGQPVDFALTPEVAAAQRRFDRLVSRRGSPTAARAYRIADSYLNSSWRVHYHPWWYPAMVARWQQRAGSGDSPPASSIWQFPGWAIHPECTALAVVFASPHWTRLAVPAPDRRHRLFYQHLLTELDVDNGRPLRTVRDFAPLPGDIQEQARWGRVLSDPEWGTPPPLSATPRSIPFIDITDDYEVSARKSLRDPAQTLLQAMAKAANR